MKRRKPISANGTSATTRKKYVRPGSAEDGDKCLLALQRDLIAMANDGVFNDDPEMKGRILAGYNPLVELAIAGVTAPNESQRIIANKIVAEFTFVPLKQGDEEASRTGQPMVITVKSWAADRPPKQIEWTPEAARRDAEEIARADNSRTPSTPEPRNPAPIGGHGTVAPGYQRFERPADSERDPMARPVAVGEVIAPQAPRARGTLGRSMQETSTQIRENRLREGAEVRAANQTRIETE